MHISIKNFAKQKMIECMKKLCKTELSRNMVANSVVRASHHIRTVYVYYGI